MIKFSKEWIAVFGTISGACIAFCGGLFGAVISIYIARISNANERRIREQQIESDIKRQQLQHIELYVKQRVGVIDTITTFSIPIAAVEQHVAQGVWWQLKGESSNAIAIAHALEQPELAELIEELERLYDRVLLEEPRSEVLHKEAANLAERMLAIVQSMKATLILEDKPNGCKLLR